MKSCVPLVAYQLYLSLPTGDNSVEFNRLELPGFREKLIVKVRGDVEKCLQGSVGVRQESDFIFTHSALAHLSFPSVK